MSAMIQDFDEADEGIPFAVKGSVLYAEQPERWHRNGITITGDMSPEQVSQEIAKAFPNDYTLMDIISALGRVKI